MVPLKEARAVYRGAFSRSTEMLLWLAVGVLLGAAGLPWLAGLPWPESVRAWLTVVENLRLPIALIAAAVVVASLLLRRGRLVVAAALVMALSGAP